MPDHELRLHGLTGRERPQQVQLHHSHVLQGGRIVRACGRRAAARGLDEFRRRIQCAVARLGDRVQIRVGIDSNPQLEGVRIRLGPESEMSRQRRGVLVDDEVDTLDRLAAGEIQAHGYQGGVQRAWRSVELHDAAAILERAARKDRLAQGLPTRDARHIILIVGKCLRRRRCEQGDDRDLQPHPLRHSHSISLNACVTLCPW